MQKTLNHLCHADSALQGFAYPSQSVEVAHRLIHHAYTLLEEGKQKTEQNIKREK